MEILLWITLVLVIFSAMLNMAVYSRMVSKSREVRQDEEVQKALEKAYLEKLSKEGHDDGKVQEAEEVRNEERGRAMDEGFDAIMRYSVSLGRGRTTGGEP